MIIEFTGPTCSGKTTIAYFLIERLRASGIAVYSQHSRDFNIGPGTLTTIRNETLQNLIMDLIAAWHIVFNPGTYARMLLFSFRVIMFGDDRFTHKLNRMRSVIRKVGINHRIRAIGRAHPIVVIDEGIIHSIHNIFVQPYAPPEEKLLDEYAEKVPLPDIIIYVKSPLDVLLERARMRKDLPRRGTDVNISDFIRYARAAFEHFMGIPVMKRRTLTVINDGGKPDKIAEEIFKHIARYGR